MVATAVDGDGHAAHGDSIIKAPRLDVKMRPR